MSWQLEDSLRQGRQLDISANATRRAQLHPTKDQSFERRGTSLGIIIHWWTVSHTVEKGGYACHECKHLDHVSLHQSNKIRTILITGKCAVRLRLHSGSFRRLPPRVSRWSASSPTSWLPRPGGLRRRKPLGDSNISSQFQPALFLSAL